MPKEVILDGFRVVLPLTPEAANRVKRVWNGLKALESLACSAGMFLGRKEMSEILAALKVLTETCETIVVASDAAAGPSSPTPKK